MNRRNAGFTLIELMVTVAIVGILAMIAIPSYRDHILRTRRAEARKELLALAAAEERFYTNCNAFATDLTKKQTDCTGLGRPAAPVPSENGYYEISLVGTATTYTLTATPVGAQKKDTGCTTLTLTDSGTKGFTGNSTLKSCWGG